MIFQYLKLHWKEHRKILENCSIVVIPEKQKMYAHNKQNWNYPK